MPPDASRVLVFVPLSLNEMALDGSNFAPEIGWINSKLMWCSHPKNLKDSVLGHKFFAGVEAAEALADAAGEAGEAGEAGGSLPSSAPVSKLNEMRP